MSALAAMQDKTNHLENSLSAETRLKLDLFSALGEAKRQMEILQGKHCKNLYIPGYEVWRAGRILFSGCPRLRLPWFLPNTSFPLDILRQIDWLNFAYTFTRSRVGLLCVNFRQFIYGPWLLLEFCFRSIWWEQIDGIWPYFAYALMLTKSSLGLLRINFCKFTTEWWPLTCQNFVSAQYLDDKSMEFD